MSDDKDKDKKAAPAHHTPAHAPAKKTAAKAAEVPRGKDGEVDLKAVKAARREDADGNPPETAEREKRPAKVHPAPHLPGRPHVAGEDPEEEAEKARGDKGDDKDAPKPDTETPFPDDQAQTLYGLRKEGRLFRCGQDGLASLLIEADDAQQAREAYCAEIRRLAGDDPEAAKGGKVKAAAGAGTFVPPGMALVPAETPAPKVDETQVKVVKLAP